MADPAGRLLIWYGTVSLLTFILFLWDKGAAIRGGRRIPEAALLGGALLGGGVGALLGMYTVRHKTGKPLFRVSVPLCALLQLLSLPAACFQA